MGKTIVITGASDGIGAAAAQQLSSRGHHVVVIGRSFHKARAVAESIDAPFHVADFSDLTDVANLAAELESLPQIDVLVNNAGGSFSDAPPTIQGFEQTFQVNCLAPFLLTKLLLPKLVASSATVVQTASIASRFGRFDVDAVDWEASNFSELAANPARKPLAPSGSDLLHGYGKAKLANIVLTRELQRRYSPQGISAVAFHPGLVASKFSPAGSGVLAAMYRTPFRKTMVSPERGADQLVWLADSGPGDGWTPGDYYENRKPGRWLNPQAKNARLAKALWDWCDQAVAV